VREQIRHVIALLDEQTGGDAGVHPAAQGHYDLLPLRWHGIAILRNRAG